MKDPKKGLRRPKKVPPLYTPNPASLLPLPRCFRRECGAVKPAATAKCPVCGSLITNSEPLAQYTVYIEEFERSSDREQFEKTDRKKK